MPSSEVGFQPLDRRRHSERSTDPTSEENQRPAVFGGKQSACTSSCVAGIPRTLFRFVDVFPQQFSTRHLEKSPSRDGAGVRLSVLVGRLGDENEISHVQVFQTSCPESRIFSCHDEGLDTLSLQSPLAGAAKPVVAIQVGDPTFVSLRD